MVFFLRKSLPSKYGEVLRTEVRTKEQVMEFKSVQDLFDALPSSERARKQDEVIAGGMTFVKHANSDKTKGGFVTQFSERMWKEKGINVHVGQFSVVVASEISDGVRIGSNTLIGSGVIIGTGAKIGGNSVIKNSVVICALANVGDRVTFQDHSSVLIPHSMVPEGTEVGSYLRYGIDVHG